MPLDKAFMKRRLKLLQDDMASRTTDPEQAREDYADEFVDMLYDFIIQATITGTVTTPQGAGAINQATIR